MPKSYYQQNKPKLVAYGREYYASLSKAERTKRGKKSTELQKKYRLTVMEHLGMVCVHCGFTDVRALQLDHIHGKGHQEILKYTNNIALYRYYTKHLDEAKVKLQVLCANCNWIKRSTNSENRVI